MIENSKLFCPLLAPKGFEGLSSNNPIPLTSYIFVTSPFCTPHFTALLFCFNVVKCGRPGKITRDEPSRMHKGAAAILFILPIEFSIGMWYTIIRKKGVNKYEESYRNYKKWYPL